MVKPKYLNIKNILIMPPKTLWLLVLDFFSDSNFEMSVRVFCILGTQEFSQEWMNFVSNNIFFIISVISVLETYLFCLLR